MPYYSGAGQGVNNNEISNDPLATRFKFKGSPGANVGKNIVPVGGGDTPMQSAKASPSRTKWGGVGAVAGKGGGRGRRGKRRPVPRQPR